MEFIQIPKQIIIYIQLKNFWHRSTCVGEDFPEPAAYMIQRKNLEVEYCFLLSSDSRGIWVQYKVPERWWWNSSPEYPLFFSACYPLFLPHYPMRGREGGNNSLPTSPCSFRGRGTMPQHDFRGSPPVPTHKSDHEIWGNWMDVGFLVSTVHTEKKQCGLFTHLQTILTCGSSTLTRVNLMQVTQHSALIFHSVH